MTIELKHSGFYFVEVTIKQLRDRLKECEDKIEATAEVKREATPEIWSCDTNVIFKLGNGGGTGIIYEERNRCWLVVSLTDLTFDW